jgi:hypothetical protein
MCQSQSFFTEIFLFKTLWCKIWSEANLSGVDKSVSVEDGLKLVAEKFRKKAESSPGRKQSGKDNVTTVPIAEFLSTKGTGNEVEGMLRSYFAEVRKVKPSWKPR